MTHTISHSAVPAATDQIARLAKALSDPSRVDALAALRGGEQCGCDLTDRLDLAPSTVSRHMSILQEAGFVRMRKDGRWRHYSLADADLEPTARALLDAVLSNLPPEPLTPGELPGCCSPEESNPEEEGTTHE